ncbi:DUF1194 domain-containing protein [Limimaricola pyoseonensis]|uniref:VWFA domain-containing protein n=1 Tax=Limimaricola pyoseonensis TaxID=521013 RepID=A0A1G7D1M0_9RHOB|nr:DUF1194 domain-containing protein [Limimaricola pyoseonensis]SDE45383.1 Protein of unknown function [Limimaricola pyoseonensis]
MIRAICGALLLAGLADGVAAQGCRQALVLGLDVSGSVDAREYALQRDGVAAALTAPDVAAALLDPAMPPVRLAVFEWSGPGETRLILPWTGIDGAAALSAAARQIRSARRAGFGPTTALGGAMGEGYALLAAQPDCDRHTLDLSADGTSNAGPRPQDTGAAPPGVTVNALLVAPEAPGRAAPLVDYFRAYVIRGADAFVETAIGFDDYEAAMRRKLLRELRALAIGARPVPARRG